VGDINHLLLQISGEYDEPLLTEEIWQTTCHLAPTLDDPAPDLWTPDQAFTAQTSFNTATVGTWTGSRNYLMEGGADDLDPLDYLLDQVGPAVRTWIETAGNGFSDAVYASKLTLYPVGTDGHVITGPVGPYKAEATPTTPVNGGVTGNLLPPQCSVVASKRSISTLAKGKGRFYLPAPAVSALGAAGQIANPANYAAGVATFVGSLGYSASLNATNVRPIVIGSPWTTGYLISSIRVGDRMDTQRRRAAQLEETYSASAVSY